MPAPYQTPVVDPKTGKITAGWLDYFVTLDSGGGISNFTNVTVNRSFTGAGGGTLDISVDAARLTGTTLAPSVVASSLTGVGTLVSGRTGRGFTVDLTTSTITGALGWSALPTGSGTWTAQPTIIGLLTVNGGIRVLDDIQPQINFRSNLGAVTNKFLSLHCAELFVETLVAQDVMATIGGRVLVGPTTSLTAAVAAADTTITVKHNQLASGDRVRLESNGHVEWMALTSSASGVAGAYVYSVTRDLDGTGANDWSIGDAVFSTGTTGDGFIDLYSTSGVLSGSGPTIAGLVRTGTTYSDLATRWAIGNLNGLYGYASDTYGAAFGDATGANVTLDAVDGFRVRDTTTVYAQLAAGIFRLGLSGGNRVEWDGTTLTVVSANVTLDDNGMVLGTSSAYDATGALKFTRPDFTSVTGDIFGVYATSDLDAGQVVTELSLENTGNAGAAAKVLATVRIRAQGWENTGAASATGPAYVECQSAEAIGKVVIGWNPTPPVAAARTATFTSDQLQLDARLVATGSITERGRTTPMGEWAPYTPTWTNLTVGNGSVVARYTRLGTTVIVTIQLVFGSTTAVTGIVRVSLPVNNIAGSVQDHGNATYFDASALLTYKGGAAPFDATSVQLSVWTSPISNVTATSPFTWTTSDQLFVRLVYEGV